MCVVAIVDTNALSVLVSSQGSGDNLFISWIRDRHGRLAFPATGQFLAEIRNNHAVMELMRRYDQGGQLRKISASELSDAHEKIDDKPHQSNDPHVLALALASNATVLCSKDKNLRLDFKDKNILPSIRREQRKLYPVDGTRKQRREFLNRQRCSDR